MALKGNLRDFTITQLLNLINLAHKTGTLVVDGTNESVRVSFREGKLSYAQNSREETSLASILYQQKKLSSAQYRIIESKANQMTDKELGLLLINAGYLTQDSILNSLKAYFIEIVYRLFSWVEGFFQFENDILPPPEKISVRVDLENIIIEGTRRLREWEQLQDEIPNLNMALKFVDRPGANIRNVNLSVEEWRVVSYINPKNTIKQIARATKMNDLEIRRIVYGLLQAGLVELIRPVGVEVRYPTLKPILPGVAREEQKSLINRIIQRIRSL
ncbi:MAG: DUF4388 domain-containing protein [Chloroflexota bacterium]